MQSDCAQPQLERNAERETATGTECSNAKAEHDCAYPRLAQSGVSAGACPFIATDPEAGRKPNGTRSNSPKTTENSKNLARPRGCRVGREELRFIAIGTR